MRIQKINLRYNTHMNKDEYVQASEIGDYVFCHRGWWLRYNNLLRTTDEMTKGTEAHNKIVKTLSGIDLKILLTLIAIGIGLIMLSITLVINFLL